MKAGIDGFERERKRERDESERELYYNLSYKQFLRMNCLRKTK